MAKRTLGELADEIEHDLSDGPCHWCGRGEVVKEYGRYYPEHHKEFRHSDDCVLHEAAVRLRAVANFMK